MAAHMLECISFTLPSVAIRKIILFSASVPGLACNLGEEEWARRRGLLLRLSLVSREFRLYTLPLLYEDIRLNLPPGSMCLSQLIATLQNSGDNIRPQEPLAIKRLGKYTKTLILIAHRVDNLLQFGGSPQELQKLMCMLPELRYIMARSPESPPHPILIHTTPTLEVRGPDTSLFLRRSHILRGALPFARRLRILFVKRPPSMLVHPPLSKQLLPDLQSISIEDRGWGGRWLFPIFNQMSSWEMPNLVDLHVELTGWAAHDESSVLSFLLGNRSPIRFLTLRTEALSGAFLLELLSHCRDLQFLECVIPQPYPLDKFPRHLALERLIFHSGERPNDLYEMVPYLQEIECFKNMSSVELPKLNSATFTWTYRRSEGLPATYASALADVNTNHIVVNGYADRAVIFQSGHFQ